MCKPSSTDLDAKPHSRFAGRPRADPDAVVDARTIRVDGVEGLFVADASVMPQLISGNTNAASLMIATKAADLISAQLTGQTGV